MEMVESVDGLKTSQSVGGRRLPNCEIDHLELQLQEKNPFGRAKGSIG